MLDLLQKSVIRRSLSTFITFFLLQNTIFYDEYFLLFERHGSRWRQHRDQVKRKSEVKGVSRGGRQHQGDAKRDLAQGRTRANWARSNSLSEFLSNSPPSTLLYTGCPIISAISWLFYKEKINQEYFGKNFFFSTKAKMKIENKPKVFTYSFKLNAWKISPIKTVTRFHWRSVSISLWKHSHVTPLMFHWK